MKTQVGIRIKVICLAFVVLTFSGCGGGSSGGTVSDPSAGGSGDAAWRLYAVTPSKSGGFSPSIWAAADDDAFAADESGRVFHYDGNRWTRMTTASTGRVNNIWGFNGEDVYTACANGVFHYDGNSWQLMPGSEINLDNWSIWGTGPNDLFVPGNGNVYHYDGSTWETMVIPGAVTLWRIWGAAGDDVFAVGNKGQIFHYDGTSWTAMNSGITSTISSVWGSASNDVYANGPSNAVLHYDGTSWSQIAISGFAIGIWGNAADNVYVSTDTSLLLYNGTDWQQVAPVGAVAIWGTETKIFSTYYSFFAGINPEVGIFTGGDYAIQYFETQSQTRTVAGSSADNILLGGLYSLGLLYDGLYWQLMPRTGAGTTQATFEFAWAVDENNIIAGSIDQIRYFDGSAWQLPMTMSGANFLGAWASSADDYFLAAGPGGVYHFNNTSGLVQMTTPTLQNINGIWGFSNNDVYAVGDQGTILHYDGSSWLEMDHPATQNLKSIWGSGPQDIYTVDDTGIILHYNGTDWSVTAAGQFSVGFRYIWGLASDNIYALAGNTIIHYDGSNWSYVDTGYNVTPKMIWGSASDNIFVVDFDGSVYRFSK